MHPGRELTEEEQRVRRAGLRLVARMIAERMLAQRAAAAAAAERASQNCLSVPEPVPRAEAERRG